MPPIPSPSGSYKTLMIILFICYKKQGHPSFWFAACGRKGRVNTGHVPPRPSPQKNAQLRMPIHNFYASLKFLLAADPLCNLGFFLSVWDLCTARTRYCRLVHCTLYSTILAKWLAYRRRKGEGLLSLSQLVSTELPSAAVTGAWKGETAPRGAKL